MKVIVSVITLAILILTLGSAEVVQSQEGVNVPIQFSMPQTFKCEENISWSKLTGWRGLSGKCGNGLLYTVVGELDSVKEGYIKAKIVIPEDNNREWTPFNGEVQEITNKRFEIQFCITTKSSTRPIWFQAYSKDGKKVGGKCTVTLVGVQLED